MLRLTRQPIRDAVFRSGPQCGPSIQGRAAFFCPCTARVAPEPSAGMPSVPGLLSGAFGAGGLLSGAFDGGGLWPAGRCGRAPFRNRGPELPPRNHRRELPHSFSELLPGIIVPELQSGGPVRERYPADRCGRTPFRNLGPDSDASFPGAAARILHPGTPVGWPVPSVSAQLRLFPEQP